jgi:hypothetical protein
MFGEFRYVAAFGLGRAYQLKGKRSPSAVAKITPRIDGLYKSIHVPKTSSIERPGSECTIYMTDVIWTIHPIIAYL